MHGFSYCFALRENLTKILKGKVFETLKTRTRTRTRTREHLGAQDIAESGCSEKPCGAVVVVVVADCRQGVRHLVGFSEYVSY